MGNRMSGRYLVAEGIPTLWLERLAARCNLTLLTTPTPRAEGDLPLPTGVDLDKAVAALLVGRARPDQMARALRRHVAAYVEVGAKDLDDASGFPADLLAAALDDGGIYVSLPTATAWALDPAGILCAALAEQAGVPADLLPGIEFAVHEAVANAMVHGNLRVDSALRKDVHRYADFCAHLADRLADPVAASRRVHIFVRWDQGRLDVDVLDEGEGFDPEKLRRAGTDEIGGRGLEMIRALCDDLSIAEGGRRVRLRFELDRQAA